MEGFQWIKVSIILGMFLGAFYVLLPTILQQDSDEFLKEEAGSVQTNQTNAVDLKLRLAVVEGDAEALRAAVEMRLLGDPDISRVQVEGKTVVVVLEAGARPDAIAETVLKTTTIELYSLEPLVTLPEDAPTDAAGLAAVEAVASLSAPSGSSSLNVSIQSAQDGVVRLTAVPEEAPGPILVVVDGVPRGVGVIKTLADEEGALALTDELDFAGLSGWSGLAGALDVTDLPGTLERMVEEQVDLDDLPVTEDEKAESSIPPWLAGLLPDTRMPLGLDLMGGIDLTLQVELDEALVNQAKRDSAYLIDQGAEEGLVFDSVDFDRSDPIIKVSTSVTASETAKFFASTYRGDYEYYDTVDGAHWFTMSGVRQDDVHAQGIEQVLDTVRRRVADIGVRDPVVVQKGGGKISVQLPGLTDLEGAVGSVSKTAVLEFRLQDHDFLDSEIDRLMADAKENLPPDQFAQDLLVNAWLWRTERLAKDRILLWEYVDEKNEETGEVVHKRSAAGPLPLEEKVVLSGADVNAADVGFDPQTQQPNVLLTFKPKGGNIFCTITGERTGKNFAIILDGEIKSAPRINERICGGRASISMGSVDNATGEAKVLASVLRTGSLDAPISIGEVRQIGPSLGADAIRAGGIATIIGGCVVLFFMVFWYRLPGMIANTALVLNVMLMLAGLSVFGWTLTLPGIAGIALTIGMAVDANIIIYERIREELQMGQLARKAVETGFQKAVVAVLDANITTGIAGVVLFSYGNVTIQGFAVTLLIGIGTTLITALFVTRTLLDVFTRRSDARLRI